MANETKWACPRCGLEGDRLKSPDPMRCVHCCRIDAADDLYAALADIVDAIYRLGGVKTERMNRARAALARARGEED